MFDACKRRVVRELNAADTEVVASQQRRPVTVVLDLDLDLSTGQGHVVTKSNLPVTVVLHCFLVSREVQEIEKVVLVEKDVV